LRPAPRVSRRHRDHRTDRAACGREYCELREEVVEILLVHLGLSVVVVALEDFADSIDVHLTNLLYYLITITLIPK
jgi:hypothetical protein